jgi:hypothetical protein
MQLAILEKFNDITMRGGSGMGGSAGLTLEKIARKLGW